MIVALLLFQLFAPPDKVLGEIDRACPTSSCIILAIQEGRVKFIDDVLHRSVDLGKYVSSAQALIPRTEAAVRDLRSQQGWRVVASAYLDHKEYFVATHVRFFGPDGSVRKMDVVLSSIEQTQIGALFGGQDQIFAITSWEEHAYNVQTKIWYLPSNGNPKLLLEVQGVFEYFSNGSANAPGVTVARQTYDGIHADTKGTAEEFYIWNRAAKTLKSSAKQR